MKVKIQSEKSQSDRKEDQGSISVVLQRDNEDRGWTNDSSQSFSQGSTQEFDLRPGQRIIIMSNEPDAKGDPLKQPVQPGAQPGEVPPQQRSAQLEANERLNAQQGGGTPGTPNPNAAQQHDIHNATGMTPNTIPQAGTGGQNNPAPTQPSTANMAAPTPQNPAATKPATGSPTPGTPAASGAKSSDTKTTPTNR